MIPPYEATWDENIVSAFTKRRYDRSVVAFCKLDPGNSSTLSSLLLFYALWLFLASSRCQRTTYTHFMIYALWYTKHTHAHPEYCFCLPNPTLAVRSSSDAHDRRFYASKPR